MPLSRPQNEYCECHIHVPINDSDRTSEDHHGHRWHRRCWKQFIQQSIMAALSLSEQLHLF